eukprot:6183096-Pleurochrysis_carterae.AAC.1
MVRREITSMTELKAFAAYDDDSASLRTFRRGFGAVLGSDHAKTGCDRLIEYLTLEYAACSVKDLKDLPH